MPRIAVVQEPPVFLDKARSVPLAVDLIARAAAEGADMVVFPETWLPGYSAYIWRVAPGRGKAATKALYALSHANSVGRTRGELDPIMQAAQEHGLVVVRGYQEVDSWTSSGTLYNSVAIIDADGALLNNHRKLMPTCPERTVWGFGDG